MRQFFVSLVRLKTLAFFLNAGQKDSRYVAKNFYSQNLGQKQGQNHATTTKKFHYRPLQPIK